MPDYLHRITKQYQTSISPSDLKEDISNYIQSPDLSEVVGFQAQYWTIVGDNVGLKTLAERDAIDSIVNSERLDAIANDFDRPQTIIKAFAEVMLDQINALRADHGRPPATMQALKTSIRSKL